MAGKGRAGRSGASLFLIEMILVIGFFAVAAAVCMRLFSEAHRVSVQSGDLSRAALCAQSAAEAWKACGGDAQRTAQCLGGTADGENVTAAYDEALDAAEPGSEQAVYLLTLSSEERDGVLTAHIEFSRADTGETVYELDTAGLV